MHSLNFTRNAEKYCMALRGFELGVFETKQMKVGKPKQQAMNRLTLTVSKEPMLTQSTSVPQAQLFASMYFEFLSLNFVIQDTVIVAYTRKSLCFHKISFDYHAIIKFHNKC